MTNQHYISEVPPHPWHTLGSDLFYHKWLDFLVVVDYFLKFLIVKKMPNSTSRAIIKELYSIFSKYGRPYLFHSDNGPCYTSEEFRIFLNEWKIEHQTSSPHYPQSNRLAESMVKVSKHLIDKATLEGLTWNWLLLDYWCTPMSSSIPSPAEVLFGRKFCSELMLPSQVINPHINSQREMITRKESKFHPILRVRQCVWIQDPASKKWNPGYPSRRRLQNQTPIGLNSMVQNTDETPTSSSLDKHRISTLHLEHQQKCISQPLKPVPLKLSHNLNTFSGCHSHRTHGDHYYKWQEDLYYNTREALWWTCQSFFQKQQRNSPRCYGFGEWHFSSIVSSTIHMTCNFQVLTTLGHWNCLCFRFCIHKTEGLSNCNQKQRHAFLSMKGRWYLINIIYIC